MSDANSDFLLNVFQKKLQESGSLPSFKEFLLIENDIDELAFDTEFPGDESPEVGSGDQFDDDLGDVNDIVVNLDTDERFLALPRAERIRIRRMANDLEPYELDDEIARAYDQEFSGKSVFTYDASDDQETVAPVARPQRDDGRRYRPKTGATHAFKIRKGVDAPV